MLAILMQACKEAVPAGDKAKTDFESLSPAQQKEKDSISLEPKNEVKKLTLTDGIKITYFEQGKGASLRDGQVLQLNYEVLLEDGTFVDGNKLLKKPWLPFMLGFGMQTPGWDIALRQLRVGDFVEIFLPAKMARGEKGIKGLIPPNSNNIIRVKIVGVLPPSREVDGTKVWLLEENKKETKMATLDDEVEFHYIVGSKSRPKYHISYRKNQPYLLRFSDFGVVKGLKKALINAKTSDKLWVLIPPEEAYGQKGLLDKVKPNEQVFYDIFVLNVR